MANHKPILCLDFDGVLHSYTSGWQGARRIPDPPVSGALEFVVGALDHFEVAILSSRSHKWGGRRAMKLWLKNHLYRLGKDGYDKTPEWWRHFVAKDAFAGPWEDEVWDAAGEVVSTIQWPRHKPPAQVTIDDRALTFRGLWPAVEDLKTFTPWNKRKVPAHG